MGYLKMYLLTLRDDEASDEVSEIRVALVELPTQRYVRRVTKTILDFLSKLHYPYI